MGVSQMFMMILVIIIVATSITVGMQYFAHENVKTARSACLSELNYFSSVAKLWWNTPIQHGGGGKATYLSGSGGPGPNNIDKLGIYIGHNYQTSGNTFNTDNGRFQILYGGENSVKFNCLSNTYFNGTPINIIFIYNMKTDSVQINIIN